MYWRNFKYAGNDTERKFNDDRVVENLYSFLGDAKKDYLPHGVTVNELLERLDFEELEEIQKDIVYSMIRQKTFNNAKVMKKWQILIGGTELDEGYQKKNDYYMSRCYNLRKPVENRKPRFQPSETLAGKYRAYIQLERTGSKESLPDGADRRFYEATV